MTSIKCNLEKIKKETVTDMDTILPWCPCGLGCHLCSGSPQFAYSTYRYYEYWKKYPDEKNQSFEDWMRIYIIPKELEEAMEKRYNNEVGKG